MHNFLACTVLFLGLLSAHSGAISAESSAPEVSAAQRWAAHIESAPESWVSAVEPLQIRFAHPVTDGGLPLDQNVEGVLTIEPRVAAEVSFTSDRELAIRFDHALDRDVEYRFTLFPNKLSGVNTNIAPYRFSIRPYQQDFGLHLDGLKIDNKDGAHGISGRITTNDADNRQKIEALLSATQEGRQLDIEWTHGGNRDHDFIITDVTRGANESEVLVSWNGAPIGVDKSGELTVQVPSTASFTALGAISKYSSDKYIAVNFSAPLDKGQSFKGLVRVQDQDVKNIRIDGNTLRIYPAAKLVGDVTVTLFEGIKSSTGKSTQGQFSQTLTILQENPGVRFDNGASILPRQSQITIPVEAVNVDSVQVTAYRMDVNNLGQFLQSRNLSIRYLDTATTAPLWRKTYRLPELPKDKWTRFDLDVTDNFRDVDNDLLAFEIRIDKSNIILDCAGPRPAVDDSLADNNRWPFAVDQQQPRWVSKYYASRGQYQWRERENPCKSSYYQDSSNKTSAFRYFHSSNIGLLAKMAVDREMLVVATDIKSGQAYRNVKVVAYNAQHQPVAKGRTDAEGMLSFRPVSAPAYLIAERGDNLGFLRLARNEALSTNVFDTGGEQSSSGLKGFFYGERGVWRPGDDIYLTFIAHDKTGRFPRNYPLTLDLFDPKGNKFDSVTRADPVNGFYHYRLKTNENSPTGNWRAVIRYGGQYFSKLLPIETIKPNRLKIELEFPGDELPPAAARGIDVGLFSQWLNGATANGLSADVQMNVSATPTRMSGYDQFVFDDPARELQARQQQVFKGSLDSAGRTRFSLNPAIKNAPGKLKLQFTTRVFEKSGNFSIQYASIPYMPYDNLVGINVPKGSGWNDSISRKDVHPIHFILLDDKSKPVPNGKLDLQVYKIGWRWWWDSGNDNIASYLSSRQRNRVVDEQLQTDANGRASWNLNGEDYRWGRYLLRVCHTGGQHCSGKIVYLGWSYNQQKNPSGDTQLILATDQDRYQVGDVARLTIPGVVTEHVDSARVLLTLESGTRILSQAWIGEDIENNQIEIPITEAMAPNVYAHVTLIQGYDNKQNDSPIRLYGIAPLLVDNPKSLLEPVLDLPEKVRPRSELRMRVSEKSGRAMTYTLAVVDEGLLGITNYQTPNPRAALFKREALGVLTWDMYDLVAKASPFNVNRLLSIGGSDGAEDEDSKRKKRRFPPIVRFIGPFTLAAGATAEHSIELPDYMGAVRVMLVAGNQAQGSGAYGKAEDLVRVTQPLTVLATLPRVLGPEESFKLPVNVFVTDDNIEQVEVRLETNELFVATQSKASIEFDSPGDKIISLDLKTIKSIGNGRVRVIARAGDEVADQTIDIPVRTANLPQLVSSKAVLQPGESRSLSVTPNGMLNTNSAYFEVSRVPQIDLESRMDYLLGYPHGCLEQATSRLFPQIYLGRLMSLSDRQKDDIQYHVDEGMRRLADFQTSSGEFNYWPGGDYSNQWSNSYAGHFLIEARRMGYSVPVALFDDWLSAQRAQARQTGERKGYESTDAYTLYTLALADAADFNAMNRLREKITSSGSKSATYRLARWLLAAAYASAGIQDAAMELLSRDDNLATDYAWSGYTYGSKLRDTAVLSMAYNRVGQQAEAWEKAQSVADQLARQNWYSTQSTAWGLIALAEYFDANDRGKAQALSFAVNRGTLQHIQLLSPIFRQALDNSAGKPIELEISNEGEKPVYVLLGNRGIPENTREIAHSKGVSMALDFRTLSGDRIDAGNIRQGEDFVASVTVSAADDRSRLENLALSMIVPGGWEIGNDRLQGLALSKQLEYQDIRDDRVLSYFTLGNYYWWHKNNERSVTVEITLNATYAGRFYLPGWQVESMYDRDISANTVGQWVNVIPQQAGE